MDQKTWDNLTKDKREALTDHGGLTLKLIGLEGWRIEVVTTYGETRRFIVDRSTGWCPCHIEVKTRRSTGGIAADIDYKSVRRIEKVR